MKTFYLFLLGALSLGVADAQAQSNVLKIDIFQPIVNTAALSFEHKLSETSSFQMGASFTGNYDEGSGVFTNGIYQNRKTSGFGIMPEYRFYLSEKHPALEGFYVAPFLRYQYLNQSARYQDIDAMGNTTYRNVEASLNAFGGGIVVGRHWIFKQRFSLDALLGPSYMVSGITQNNADFDKSDFLGFYEDMNYGIRGAVTFGFAF